MFGSKKLMSRALAAGLILGLSSLMGAVAQNSAISEPTLDVTIYLVEDSTAQFFYSDEFGNFTAENSITSPVLRGVNSLRLPLGSSPIRESFSQRFDPCECDTPVLVSRMLLTSPLLTEQIPSESWVLGGDTKSLTNQAAAVLLRSLPTGIDPQLALFLEIDDFADRAETRAFWVGFFATLFTLGGLLWSGLAWIRWKHSNPSLGINSPRRSDRAARVPLWLTVVASVVLTGGVIQQFVGAWVIGGTLDEHLHVWHLEDYFETGVYSSSVYGPVTSLLGHAANVLLGLEQWGAPVMTAEAYAVRHVVIAGIGLAGLAAVLLLGRIVFKSWGWGVVSAACLASLPLWVGHSMFNVKDISVATGYTMATAALVLVLSREWSAAGRVFGSVALFSAGTLLAAGTRPAAFALIGASALLALVLWVAIDYRRWSYRLRWIVLGIATLVLAAGSVLLVPLASSPLAESLERSVDFPWGGWNLYGGVRADSQPGLLVVLGAFFARVPILFTIFLVAGTLFGLILGVRALIHTRSLSFQTVAFVLIAAQAFGAFIAVGLLDVAVYYGGRQIIFVLPALAVLAAWGIRELVIALTLHSPSSRITRTVVGVVAATGFVIPLSDQIALFPYNYTYLNVVAQGQGVTGYWETDYWNASIREAVSHVAPDDPATCRSVGDLNINLPNVEPCTPLEPYVGEGAQGTESELAPRSFWTYRTDRTLAIHGPVSSDNCEFHSQVTRPLRGEEVVMSWVYQCEDR
jgi:hypothetical protein